MILVLRGADFSANNIGKVTFGFDERTKLIMSKYGRDFSTEEGVAIQAFMNGLDSSGILPKLSGLYMPAFASSLDTAFVNLADAEFNTDILSNTTGISFADGSIKNDGTNSNFYVTIGKEVTAKRNNVLMASYGLLVSSENIQFISASMQCNNLYAPVVVQSSYDVSNYFKAAAYRYGSPNRLPFIVGDNYGMTGLNFREADLSNNTMVLLGQYEAKHLSAQFTENSNSVPYSSLPADEQLTTKLRTTMNKSMQGPCKMIVLGEALSDDQLTKFYELVNNVMGVFKR